MGAQLPMLVSTGMEGVKRHYALAAGVGVLAILYLSQSVLCMEIGIISPSTLTLPLSILITHNPRMAYHPFYRASFVMLSVWSCISGAVLVTLFLK